MRPKDLPKENLKQSLAETTHPSESTKKRESSADRPVETRMLAMYRAEHHRTHGIVPVLSDSEKTQLAQLERHHADMFEAVRYCVRHWGEFMDHMRICYGWKSLSPTPRTWIMAYPKTSNPEAVREFWDSTVNAATHSRWRKPPEWRDYPNPETC